MIDEKRIAEIRERCGKAAPGKWETNSVEIGRGNRICLFANQILGPDGKTIGATDENAKFIAHAREDIPYLLGEIDRLKTLAENGLNAMDRGKRLDAAIAGQETLQKTLSAYITGTNHLKKRIARLEDKLAESQRREQAAVEDLSTYKDCGFCIHLQDQQYCYKNCQRHVDVDNFRTHPCWQWRGPEEAGERP